MIFIKKNYIPLFSIILTTFNRENLFQRAINSLKKQTEKDWECLIIDDGSEDETFKIAIELCKKDQRFRYVYQCNRGQAAAKNIGIKNSTGEYVTFLDSDDEYKNDHLEIRKEILNQNPEIELLHGGIKIIGDKYVPDLKTKGNLISVEDCVIGGTFFIKRKLLENIGGFDLINYADDTHFFEKMRKNKFKIAETTYKSYIYHREHNNSITSNYE